MSNDNVAVDNSNDSNSNMRCQWIGWILFVLSRFPIFSITFDQNFHEINVSDYVERKFEIRNLRYSLISFGLGTKKIYFLTLKSKKIKFIKILKLEDFRQTLNMQKINEKVEVYRNSISSKRKEDIEIEINFLRYKIEQNENTKNIALAKMNIYTTIVLVFIPLLFSNWSKIYDTLDNWILKILGVIIFYHLINMVIYILKFFKVKSFVRTLFKDLKESDKHLNKLAESFYQEWYVIKEEAPMYVDYVLNIQKYIKNIIILMIVFIIASNINGIYLKTVYNSVFKENVNQYSNTDIFIDEKGKISNKDLTSLINIEKQLASENIKQVLILRNLSQNDLVVKRYNNIIDAITLHNINQRKVIEINLFKDKNLKENCIKIILLRGQY